MTDEERFWGYVRKDCWIWTGAKQRAGYGHIRLGGKDLSAHRIAWEWANGRKIPEGMEIMHLCDVRACVNPAHLKLATREENMADMMKKRRGAFGARNCNARLTEEQAKEILSLKGTTTGKELCKRYGVGPGCVTAIWRGDLWKHLSKSA